MLEDGTVNIESISFSALEMFSRCGQQFKFRYIDGLKQPPNIVLAEGVANHKALELDNLEKFERGKQLSPSKLTEIFSENLKTTVKEFTGDCEALKVSFDWGEETDKGLHARAKKWHHEYAHDFSKDIEPAEKPETAFTKEFDVNGIKGRVHGQSDVITKAEVIDYKTSSKEKSQGEVDNSLQLTLYSWAKKIPRVSYIAFIKSGDPHVQKIGAIRKPSDWLWGVNVVAHMVRAIRSGVFYPVNPGANPPPWYCSERFCGFWKICRGRYQK